MRRRRARTGFTTEILPKAASVEIRYISCMASAFKPLFAAALLMAAASARAQDACQDLSRRARWLRNGANNCDAAVAQGQMSSCQVSVTFSLADVPALAVNVPADVPWLTTPAAARDLAAKLDAIKCVEKLEITVDPPGPFRPGDKFTITAKVTMAGGASSEGLQVSLTPKDEGLIAFNDAGEDNGTRVAHKAGGPVAPLPAAVTAARLRVGPDGTVKFKGTYSPTETGTAPGTGEEIDAGIDFEGLKEVLLGGAATVALTLALLDSTKCVLKPGEDVLDRFLDGTRLTGGYLQIHEDNGGHAIDRHVGKSLKYLMTRLRDPMIKDASSYNDRPTADIQIRRAAMEKQPEITLWYLSGMNSRLTVHVAGIPGAGPIGYGVSSGNPDPTPVPKFDNAAVMVPAYSCHILILTSFPE
ncbi:MAG: RNase A-like domain-containing protein [Elusimicrobiota bacterium]